MGSQGIDAQVLKGHLDLLLLSALKAGPAHGYGIAKEIRRRSDDTFDLAEGTVYPALHRLEKDGLIESEWLMVSGRRRRVYCLTRRGNAALGEKKEHWGRFSRGMSAALEGTR